MTVEQRVYDVDTFWRFVCQPENVDRYFELMNGEVIEMSPPGWEHGTLAGEIYHAFRLFDPERRFGSPSVDTGFYPADDRRTVLSPDVAFTRIERAPARTFTGWAPFMPDIAVEVKSPSNTLAELRRKAAIYLRQGTQLVWIVMPKTKRVEVCRLEEGGEIQTDVIGAEGALSGEGVLPGFRLELSALFV